MNNKSLGDTSKSKSIAYLYGHRMSDAIASLMSAEYAGDQEGVELVGAWISDFVRCIVSSSGYLAAWRSK